MRHNRNFYFLFSNFFIHLHNKSAFLYCLIYSITSWVISRLNPNRILFHFKIFFSRSTELSTKIDYIHWATVIKWHESFDSSMIGDGRAFWRVFNFVKCSAVQHRFVMRNVTVTPIETLFALFSTLENSLSIYPRVNNKFPQWGKNLLLCNIERGAIKISKTLAECVCGCLWQKKKARQFPLLLKI